MKYTSTDGKYKLRNEGTIMTNTMTRAQAVRFVQDHGYTTTQQTATFNGAWVESGTSFDETFGVCETYNRSAVRSWMGY